MVTKCTGLEYSWKTLLSAEKVLSSFLDLSKSRDSDKLDSETPDVSYPPPSTKSTASHYGGLLNNLNDPAKYPKRNYSLRTRKTLRPSGAVQITDSSHDLTEAQELNTSLICRSLSKSPGNFFAQEKKKKLISPVSRLEPLGLYKAPGGELAVTLRRVSLNHRHKLVQRHRTKQIQGSNPMVQKTYVSKGLDTSDPDDIRSSPVIVRSDKESSKRPKMELAMSDKLETISAITSTAASTTQKKKNVISKYIEHMLREQSHKRTLSKHIKPRPGSKSHFPRGPMRNSDALKMTVGLDNWKEFAEVLVGERPGSRAIVKFPTYRTSESPG